MEKDKGTGGEWDGEKWESDSMKERQREMEWKRDIKTERKMQREREMARKRDRVERDGEGGVRWRERGSNVRNHHRFQVSLVSNGLWVISAEHYYHTVMSILTGGCIIWDIILN